MSRSALLSVFALSLILPGCEDPNPKPNDDVDPDEVGGGVGGGTGDGGADGASDGGDGGAADVGDCVDVNLGDALGSPVHEGSTAGAGDDRAYCAGGGSGDVPDIADTGWGGDSGWSTGGGAPDLVFQWQAPASGTYTFATRGTRFDTTLTVLDGSCEGRVIDCDDDGGADLDSRMVVRVTEGDVLLIVLDGYSRGEEGAYQLHITEGGTEPDDSGVIWEDTAWGGGGDPPEPAAMLGALLGALGSAAVGLAGLVSRRRRTGA